LLARAVAFAFVGEYLSTELDFEDFISFRLILKFSFRRLRHCSQ